jgi:hypothetical protein
LGAACFPVKLGIHPSGVDSIMPKTLATATVGSCTTPICSPPKGNSHRLAEALACKAVVPLN